MKNLYQFVEENDKYVESIAWNTPSITTMDPRVLSTYITNIGHTYQQSINIWAVSKNYFDVTLSKYLEIDSSPNEKSNNGPTMLQQLYQTNGTILLGKRVKNYLHLFNNEKFSDCLLISKLIFCNFTDTHFILRSKLNSTLEIKKLTPIGFLKNSPHFQMTENSNYQDAIVSLNTYSQILQTTFEIPPAQVVYFKLRSTISDEQRYIFKARFQK
jgi:hypothetical protein